MLAGPEFQLLGCLNAKFLDLGKVLRKNGTDRGSKMTALYPWR